MAGGNCFRGNFKRGRGKHNNNGKRAADKNEAERTKLGIKKEIGFVAGEIKEKIDEESVQSSTTQNWFFLDDQTVELSIYIDKS